MIESYFNQYNKVIAPTKRQLVSSGKDLNQNIPVEIASTIQSTLSREKMTSAKRTDNIISNINDSNENENLYSEVNVEDVRSLYLNERKKNLEYRHEMTSLKNKVNQLQIIVNDKEHELAKLRLQTERDGTYLLQLEKLITQLKGEKAKKTIQSTPATTITNNTQIVKPSIVKVQNQEDMLLKEEVVKLREFKTAIINISKEKDSLNLNIFTSLKRIEELMFNLQQVFKDRLEDVPLQYQNFYDMKYSTLNEIKEHYDKVMDTIMETMKNKEDEYHFLLHVKEEESELLLKEIETLRKDKNDLQREIEEKNKIINTLKVENEFIALRDQVKLDEKKKEKIGEKLRMKENNDKRTIDNKVKEMKRSVNRSIGKIKRHFDMADPDNIELINNIHTQINE